MREKIEDWNTPSPYLSRRSVVRGAGGLTLALAGASALGGLMTTAARRLHGFAPL